MLRLRNADTPNSAAFALAWPFRAQIVLALISLHIHSRHMLPNRELKIAEILRPLGTGPLSRQMAMRAAQLLNVHWTSVYRLRRRFLAHPVASLFALMGN